MGFNHKKNNNMFDLRTLKNVSMIDCRMVSKCNIYPTFLGCVYKHDSCMMMLLCNGVQ